MDIQSPSSRKASPRLPTGHSRSQRCVDVIVLLFTRLVITSRTCVGGNIVQLQAIWCLPRAIKRILPCFMLLLPCHDKRLRAYPSHKSPQGLLWLLLTGNIPSTEQAMSLSRELRAKAEIPPCVLRTLKALPPGTHPMTQLSVGVMAMQSNSVFAKAYQQGTPKR